MHPNPNVALKFSISSLTSQTNSTASLNPEPFHFHPWRILPDPSPATQPLLPPTHNPTATLAQLLLLLLLISLRRPTYAYAYNYDPSAAAASRAAFLRRILAAMIAFFIISASIVFIVWLVLRPRLPKFWVDSFALNNLNTSSQTLSGDWAVGFSVYNPDKKMSIVYDEINSGIVDKSAFLSETRIAPLDQGKKDRTVVNATFSVRNSYVEDWVVRGISDDRPRGTVNFHVRVWARVGFRTGGWRLRRRLLRVRRHQNFIEFGVLKARRRPEGMPGWYLSLL